MLPLDTGSGILSLLFGKGKDKELEAEKRGIERAARIYEPILNEIKEYGEQLISEYAFDKERFSGLIDKKVEYLKKLEKDILRYKEVYKEKLKSEMEQYNSKGTSKKIGATAGGLMGAASGLLAGSGIGSSLAGVAASGMGIVSAPIAIGVGTGFFIGKLGYSTYKWILKREKEIQAIENRGFENAQKMWEIKISECRKNMDILKSKGDKESQNLINLYDKCISKVIEHEKVIAYYQERVGDLG